MQNSEELSILTGKLFFFLESGMVFQEVIVELSYKGQEGATPAYIWQIF